MRQAPILILVAALAIVALVRLRPPETAAGALNPAAAGSDASSTGVASLESFRAHAGAPATAFEDGSPSRDSLVRRFVHALDASDTTALHALALTSREFAWIYYPASGQSRPPYELDADIMWHQIQAQSARGLARLLREYGGGRLDYRGYACDSTVIRERAVTSYTGCRLTHKVEGRDVTERLFGSIVEHGGQFKLVGFANRL